jgi:hypothetical protein
MPSSVTGARSSHLRELRPALLLIVARRLKACQRLGLGGHVVYGFIKRWHYEQ